MREKVIKYLQTADEQNVKAVFAFVENKIGTDAHSIDDETFKELKRRTKSFLDGSAKMYTLEDAKKIARERFTTKGKS
jgi:hypothetical protein